MASDAPLAFTRGATPGSIRLRLGFGADPIANTKSVQLLRQKAGWTPPVAGELYDPALLG